MNNKPYLQKYHDKIALDSKANSRDRIWLSYVDEKSVKLTKKEIEQKRRYEQAISLLNGFFSPEKTISKLMKNFHGISRAQAYRDMNDAVLIFGNLKESLQEGVKHILYEYAMKTMQMAKEQNDLKAMNMAWKNLYLAMGLDKEGSRLISPEDFEGNQYVIEINVPGAGRKRKPINIDDLQEMKPGKLSEMLEAVEAQVISEEDIANIIDEENQS